MNYKIIRLCNAVIYYKVCLLFPGVWVSSNWAQSRSWYSSHPRYTTQTGEEI